MSVENINKAEKELNIIEYLCEWFDFFASPDIEEKTINSTDCCIVSDYTRLLINICNDTTQSIIREPELKAVCQLDEMLHDVWGDIGYGQEKGFSKTQCWLDFVDVVNKLNVLLKNAVKRYQARTERIT